MKKLQDKVAIVTGASKGIGAAIARYLAKEGAAVVVNYASSKKDADRVVDEIARGGGRAVALQANVAKQGDIERLFAETKKNFGRLDILVNNAGVYEFAPVEAITEAHFRKLFDVNVLGTLLASQAAARLFDAAGGSIINISSAATSLTAPSTVVYTASKAAVEAITQTLAKELGPRNIRVNSINPGMIETAGTHAAGLVGSDFQKTVETLAPLGRMGQPDDIWPTAVYLASSDSKYVSGETLAVSGGMK